MDGAEPPTADAAVGRCGRIAGLSHRRNGLTRALSPSSRDNFALAVIAPNPLIEEFLKTAGSLPCADARKFASQTEPRIRIDTMTNSDTKRLLEASLHLIRCWKDSSSQ
jgi:hypothetical protein